MSYVDKKFLNAAGVTQIVQLLDNYVTTGMLSTVVNSIDTVLGSKADKTNTVLLSTLSCGRTPNTTIGERSFAFGTYVTASGINSFAIGSGTQALGEHSVTGGGGVTVSGDYSLGFGGGVTVSGDYSVGFGGGTYVSGNDAIGIGSGIHALGLCSAAFGGGNRAYGDYSFVAGGGGSIASGYCSTAIGDGLIANGGCSFVHGRYNVADTSEEYPEWVSDTQYYEDDIVKITMTDPSTDEIYYKYYKCAYDNNDHEFSDWNWNQIPNPRTYAEIVGGGTDDDHRKNIRVLDWNGNLYLKGDVFVKCNDSSLNGKKLIDETDIATSTHLGIVKVNGYGIDIDEGGKLYIHNADTATIRNGTSNYSPITPSYLDDAIYFGLSKLVGVDLKNSGLLSFQDYPDASKQGIQKKFGFDGILGDYESATASKAYAIGETFIYNGKRYRVTVAIAQGDVIAPGTNCELDPLDGKYVRNTDYATSSTCGVVKVNQNFGIGLINNVLYIKNASVNEVKVGTNTTNPITPNIINSAAFYGLAKAAGDTTQASSSNAVGDYTQSAKTAIQTMLGIDANIPLVETVVGVAPTINGAPNVRYICSSALSSLIINPPTSGTIVVRFTAGSNCIVSLPQTVKLPEWFDISTDIEAGKTYEFLIEDGVYGGIMSWAT